MSWNYRFVHKVARMKIKGEIHQEDVVDVHEVLNIYLHNVDICQYRVNDYKHHL